MKKNIAQYQLNKKLKKEDEKMAKRKIRLRCERSADKGDLYHPSMKLGELLFCCCGGGGP